MAIGRGRNSDRSDAFDLAEVAEDILRRFERAYYEPDLLSHRDWVMEQQSRINVIRDRLKQRTLRDRK